MDSSTSLDPMWPVCTKLVGLPIMDRSILNRWWWRLRRGLCGWWKQHENHCNQISPVLAILPLFSFLSTLDEFGIGPCPRPSSVCSNKEVKLDATTSWYSFQLTSRLSEAKVLPVDNPIAPPMVVTHQIRQCANKFSVKYT